MTPHELQQVFIHMKHEEESIMKGQATEKPSPRLVIADTVLHLLEEHTKLSKLADFGDELFGEPLPLEISPLNQLRRKWKKEKETLFG